MLPAASMLERAHAALVVIDIQERLASAMSRRARVMAETTLLIEAAAITGVPVIATRQYPKGLGPLEPGIVTALSAAEKGGTAVHGVDKMSFDCFAEPSFCDALAATGRRQVVIAGMETHICVAQTALSAIREGFDVHVAADACCSIEEESRDVALSRLSCAGVVLTTAESAAYELVGRAGTDEFKALLGAVKRCAGARDGA